MDKEIEVYHLIRRKIIIKIHKYCNLMVLITIEIIIIITIAIPIITIAFVIM
jgi:hypothetical protein